MTLPLPSVPPRPSPEPSLGARAGDPGREGNVRPIKFRRALMLALIADRDERRAKGDLAGAKDVETVLAVADDIEEEVCTIFVKPDVLQWLLASGNYELRESA